MLQYLKRKKFKISLKTKILNEKGGWFLHDFVWLTTGTGEQTEIIAEKKRRKDR